MRERARDWLGDLLEAGMILFVLFMCGVAGGLVTLWEWRHGCSRGEVTE